MIQYKKILITLALLLTAVTGAWAQSSFGVVEFKVPADWETAQSNVTAADLPGFKASTLDEAKAWGATTEGSAVLFYAFDGENASYVFFIEGSPTSYPPPTPYTKKTVFSNSKSGVKYYYTTELTEWELTSKDGKNWILAKMPANNIELQVEYEPTKVTMAANDNTMGTVEVSGENKVEWTADTWKGWTSDTKEYTVDDITVTSIQYATVNEYTYEGDYLHSLNIYVSQEDNNSTVTFSTTGDPFSRIEFTMIDDYDDDEWYENKGWIGNPTIMPNDNWTFSGKSAVWEGEATKSLTLQSCTTKVSKITFFKGAVPDGVTVKDDGTFTVAKTATVTLTATPKEGYKFLYWEDDQTNTNPVREVTIESGMADMTYKAVFAEPTFNVTFVEGTNLNEWTATPNTEVKKDTKVDIKYNGTKKVLGVTVAKYVPIITWDNTNVFVEANQDKSVDKWNPSATFEGITISFSFNGEGTASHFYPYNTMGADLDVLEYGDSFTFTAPTGKKFAKIEINGSFSNLNDANWSTQANGIVWSNTPSNTVTIARTESYSTDSDYITSIVFTLSE